MYMPHNQETTCLNTSLFWAFFLLFLPSNQCVTNTLDLPNKILMLSVQLESKEVNQGQN